MDWIKNLNNQIQSAKTVDEIKEILNKIKVSDLDKVPDKEITTFYIAREYTKVGNYNKAIEFAKMASENSKNPGEFYDIIGDWYQMLPSPNEGKAIEYYEKGIENNCNESRLSLAKLYYEQCISLFKDFFKQKNGFVTKLSDDKILTILGSHVVEKKKEIMSQFLPVDLVDMIIEKEKLLSDKGKRRSKKRRRRSKKRRSKKRRIYLM
jgi:tetratricopeptide (TPR) repeat protein